MSYLPRVKVSVEDEPPDLLPLVWSVDEWRVHGHGPCHVHLARDDCVVGEHPELPTNS